MNENINKFLRTRAFLVLTLCALAAVAGVTALTTKYVAIGPIQVYSLVTGEQTFNFDMLTNTQETISEVKLCDIHTYGKAVRVFFAIANTTAELEPYLDRLEIRVRMTTSGFDQHVTTLYDGNAIFNDYLEAYTNIHEYDCMIRITYHSKSQPGTLKIGLSIWAES